MITSHQIYILLSEGSVSSQSHSRHIVYCTNAKCDGDNEAQRGIFNIKLNQRKAIKYIYTQMNDEMNTVL